MFPEHQISILEWFLKDNMTLNSGIMMLKIQLCVTGTNWILKYIQMENSTVILIAIIFYCFYCIFDQINAAYHRIAHLKLLFENMGVSHTQKPFKQFKHSTMTLSWGGSGDPLLKTPTAFGSQTSGNSLKRSWETEAWFGPAQSSLMPGWRASWQPPCVTLTGLSVNQFNGIPETRPKMDGSPGACKERSVHHGSLLSKLKPMKAPEYISIRLKSREAIF